MYLKFNPVGATLRYRGEAVYRCFKRGLQDMTQGFPCQGYFS